MESPLQLKQEKKLLHYLQDTRKGSLQRASLPQVSGDEMNHKFQKSARVLMLGDILKMHCGAESMIL